MLGFLQTNVLIILGFLLSLFIGYFLYSQWNLTKLSNEIVLQDVTIKNQELIVEQMTTDIQSIKRINEELIELDREAEESRNNLNSIITDIETTEDSIEKEIKVNSMFRDRMRCMELATGSIPAKDETNTICPHYLK